MIKFMYFARRSMIRFDPVLKKSEYQHAKWFDITWPGCSHITSRVGQLTTPWQLTDSLFPISNASINKETFDQSIERVAEKLIKKVHETGRRPYLYWSGGIDSTAILVSILKVANQEFLDQLTVLHDHSSIQENAYFYYYYIDQKLKTVNINAFNITPDNYNQVIVIDGEGGNQCMGGHSIYQMCQMKQFDLLNQPWRSVDFESIEPKISNFNLNLIKESIDLAPIEISTLYDFIWWSNFNFKFDDAMIRKMIVYGKNLTALQRQEFWQDSLYRFFQQSEIQSWSINSLTERRETAYLDPKYIVKKYIHDFDHNDLWYAFKKEQGSVPELFALETLPIIGYTPDWQIISVADTETRQELKKILQR